VQEVGGILALGRRPEKLLDELRADQGQRLGRDDPSEGRPCLVADKGPRGDIEPSNSLTAINSKDRQRQPVEGVDDIAEIARVS
jgi:hypothetical protein